MSLTPTPAAAPSGCTRLVDWGVIRARGADAASFLHGQLTQDVAHLPEGQVRLAGYCSPKGRLLASFVVWRSGPDEILLACSADLLPATLKRLSMFVLRAKCKLDDASAEWPLHGLAGDAATAWLGAQAPAEPWRAGTTGPAQVLRLPDAPVAGQAVARYLLAQPADVAQPALPALEPGAWPWLEVNSGIARIVAATVEQFVPQMVNLELVGGVNFQKGCYPGQEVVARSQYRGTTKRRAMVFDGDTPMQPGQEVFHSSDPGQPAGLVANAGQWGGAHAALVEVKLAALTGGTGPGEWHLGSPDGAVLRPGALPYALPVETEAA